MRPLCACAFDEIHRHSREGLIGLTTGSTDGGGLEHFYHGCVREFRNIPRQCICSSYYLFVALAILHSCPCPTGRSIDDNENVTNSFVWDCVLAWLTAEEGFVLRALYYTMHETEFLSLNSCSDIALSKFELNSTYYYIFVHSHGIFECKACAMMYGLAFLGRGNITTMCPELRVVHIGFTKRYGQYFNVEPLLQSTATESDRLATDGRSPPSQRI